MKFQIQIGHVIVITFTWYYRELLQKRCLKCFSIEGQSGQKEHFLISIYDLLILINHLLILINDFLISINDLLISINGMIY